MNYGSIATRYTVRQVHYSQVMNDERISVQTGSREIDVSITRRPRQKHIHIRVGIDGGLRVSAPLRCSTRRISEAIRTKEPWIGRQFERILGYRRYLDPHEWVLYNGSRFRLVRVESQREHADLDEANGMCRISAPKEVPTIQLVRRRLETEARVMLPERVKRLAETCGIRIERVFIRNQRTRWGSSSSLGNVSLNWRLIMAPQTVRDYLILHEIAHQRYMNHSSGFWQQVADWCPEYQDLERWLSDHAFLLALFR